MAFFQPPPPPPARRVCAPHETEWSRPLRNSLGALVPWRLLLAENEQARIVLHDAIAHANGLAFKIETHLKSAKRLDGRFFHRVVHPLPTLHDEFLRFGVELADGTRLTNLDERAAEPSGPVLARPSAGGGGRTYSFHYWLWPLPPPGRLAFVCEWPAFDVPQTRLEVDAGEALEASARARMLWA